eukprot:726254_1
MLVIKSNVLLLSITLFSLVSAKSPKTSPKTSPSKSPSKSPAYWAGNNNAAGVWDTKPYLCSLDGIADYFWKDVKETIFPQCDSDYKFNSGNRDDCRRGAEDYVTLRANDCVKKGDCEKFGEHTARDIADANCPRSVPGTAAYSVQGPKLLPPRCEAWAKDACKSTVESEVQERIRQGICESVSMPFSYEFRKGLGRQCDIEVKKRVEDAKLH